MIEDVNAAEPVGGILGVPFSEYTPPSWDVYFMRQVYEVATKSKDPSTKIGAVIVRNKHPILFGYNGLPPLVNDFPERMVRPTKYKWTEHGERNAIFCGAAFGISTAGTSLFTQELPCSDCGRAIVAAGIKEVVIHEPASRIFRESNYYNEVWKLDHEVTETMFLEAGVQVRTLLQFVGKAAFIGGKKYEV